MASDNDTLFNDDFTGTSPVLQGERPSFSQPFACILRAPNAGESQAGNARVNFDLEVVEDPSGRNQEGCVITSGQNVPAPGKDGQFARRLWLTILASCGNNVAQFKKKLDIKMSHIADKRCYVTFITPEDKGNKYGDVKFLTEAQYASAAKRIAERAAKGELETAPADEDIAPDVTIDEAESVNGVTPSVDEKNLLSL